MDRPGTRSEDSFSTHLAFLKACESYFEAEASSSTSMFDQSSSLEVNEMRKRVGKLKSRWAFRSINVDSRFRGPSTPTGYFHRRDKLVKRLTRTSLLPSGSEGRWGEKTVYETGFEQAEEAEMMEEGEDEATMDLQRRERYFKDQMTHTENGDPAASGCLPAMTTSTDTCSDHSRSAPTGDQETPSNRDSEENWIPVMVDWYIAYHPAYRIPQLSFDVSEQDGKSVSLSNIIRMGIVVVPHTPSETPTSAPYSPTSGYSPNNTNITDPMTSETDHIPLAPDSPFPLLIRDSNLVLGSSLGFVWTIHPCAVGTHVGELVGDTECYGGKGEQQEEQGVQEDTDRRGARRMERWMDVWFGLHSRILPDLAK